MKILCLDQSGNPSGTEVCLIDIAKPYCDRYLLPSRQKDMYSHKRDKEDKEDKGANEEIHSLRLGME